ncbi:MAG: hypothetical protein OXU36_08965 [Candidatus Poribacteria bacterium]|nr:hypothetical protein [Candidatus Poribacteria bacterium]
MHIARLSLICLIAFVFMVGCGMLGKKAEMSETAATSMEGATMESEAKADMAESMEEAAVEEITLNVTGMT